MRFTAALLFAALSLAACSSSDPAPGEDGCPQGQARCGDACVDLKSDDSNCGSCGVQCIAETTCKAGACAIMCMDGSVDCDGAYCAFVDDDPANCGACGHACDEGEACSEGSCVPSCGDTEMRCDGQCVDWNDPAHCGACDRACAETEVCNLGTCEPFCDLGLDPCDGACVDLDRDDANCGACGNACTGGRACEGGSCACPEGTELCGGVCVDTQTDAAHCGACDAACEPGVACEGGACGCPGGQTRCEGMCVNTSTDASNCGTCGNVCEVGDHAMAGCATGSCTMACQPGYEDCDGLASTGCESNPLTDAANCGACGNACAATEACTGGVCCGPGGAICGGACVDPQNDPRHCGGCGISCLGLPGTTSGTCDAGACELACTALRGDCNDLASDGCERELAEDAENCGACGNTCGAICGGGDCVAMTFPPKMFHTSCVLADDGKVYCWGQNGCGQVGNGSAPAANCNVGAGSVGVPKPTLVAGLGTAVSLAVGEFHNCAILSDSGVKCWGLNHKGQLGAGDTNSYSAPVSVMSGGAALQGATALALTDSSTCAVVGGNVLCWGNGQYGRLGNGDTTDALAPVMVMDGAQPLSNVVGLAAGLQHVCALRQGGSVSCWGRNLNGQLGRGTSGSGTDASTPAAIAGLTGVDELLAAGYRTCARIGGTARCWGQNLSGQNGTGNTTESSTPLDIVGLTTAISITMGQNHTCAVLTGGQAICWGLNSFGQLGNGATSTGAQATPVTVVDPATGQPMTGIRSMTAGGAHSCLVMDDDSVQCLGYDNVGQLGNGQIPSNPNQPNVVPVPVVW